MQVGTLVLKVVLNQGVQTAVLRQKVVSTQEALLDLEAHGPKLAWEEVLVVSRYHSHMSGNQVYFLCFLRS